MSRMGEPLTSRPPTSCSRSIMVALPWASPCPRSSGQPVGLTGSIGRSCSSRKLTSAVASASGGLWVADGLSIADGALTLVGFHGKCSVFDRRRQLPNR